MGGKSLWFAFWSRVGTVGIRTKIMGIVAVCILSSAMAVVWYTYNDVSSALRGELQRRGIAIGTSLAAQSRDPLLTDNQFALYTLVKQNIEANDDLVYTFIVDSSGVVLVHSFESGFPSSLIGINKLTSGEPYHIVILETGDDTIQDIAIPVLGGKAGVIRLGMSEANINAIVAGHVRGILLWVAPIFVLGLSVAYGLAFILTEPISRLADAARAIGKGNFKWKTPVWAKDEIGTLGTAFNEMSAELKRKEEMRAQLLAKVITAQEEERKRIARELHDETSQSITSMMVGLKLIEDSTSDVKISKMTGELRLLAAQTLDEVHNLAMELRPSLLDDLGLGVAIQRYASEYSVKMKIKVDSHISGLSKQRLPGEIEVAVYRIIQEALTNIAKHARADNVSVILRCQNSSLVAIIEDNGKGFDINNIMSSAKGKKLGLFGMHERASLISGDLTIESKPGSGTTIFLEVPLEQWQETFDG